VPEAAERLTQGVRARDKHLTTGFLGTSYLLHVLSRFGDAGVAFDVLTQRSYPSWLYPTASASLETPYGTLTSTWRLEPEQFVLALTVPANTSEEVTLWDTRIDRVQEGGLPLNAAAGVRAVRRRGNDVVVEVCSGRYSFTAARHP